MIQAHGGKLTHNYLSDKEVGDLKGLKKLILDYEEVKDVKNITRGVYSPLFGFSYEYDFQGVLDSMHLKNGIIWPIPIILDLSKEEYKELKNEKRIELIDKDKNDIGILEDIQIYKFDKRKFCEKVYGTKDKSHPGVNEVYKMGDYLIGGKIYLVEGEEELYPEYNLTPKKTREVFNMRGWHNIVAFQTRNVPHRGHEFLQKEALKEVDGLFIQPVIGEKKLADFKDEYILSSYEVLIDHYYPRNKVVLGILPYKMKYAGPREAVLHALIRKNYGCSHMIIGRDHAGVKDFYPPYAAQEIFDEFKDDEIGMTILKYPEVVYDKKKKIHCFIDGCNEKDMLKFSGTKLREHINDKTKPEDYLLRPEVYKLLLNGKNSLVDDLYKNGKKQKGFVLWLTGLSQSGKSTIADEVYERLKAQNIKVERLDGDIVRETISKDLGFSQEDREENIRRVGFVAKLLSRNGVGVIASFISPYRKQRSELKRKIENFIEVFVNTPLEVCEKRDKKGLYKKARKGEIKNFTGISAPFEEPRNPDIEIMNANTCIETGVEKIIKYLNQKRIIS